MANSVHTPRVVLVTGGAGFIGSHMVRFLLADDPNVRVINYDALTYAGSLSNIAGLEELYGDRYRFYHADICDEAAVRQAFEKEDVDTVIHLAAESHVDRSITDPGVFIETNVMGTCLLLRIAREHWNDRPDVRFHHVSTDEVYGDLGDDGLFTESTPYDPSSPYSASKAASDHFVRAWHRTYGLPVTLSNCSNNYGPYQFPEKLIPQMILKATDAQPLPVYGEGLNVRDWLFVEDHCEALDLIVRQGAVGRTYNVGANNEWTNIALVEYLCDTLQEIRPHADATHYRDLITFVQDRPGHDLRYAIDSSRLRDELGWRQRHTFEDGLRETITWYLDHQEWIADIRRKGDPGVRLGL